MIFFFKVRYIQFYTILIDHLYDSFWGIWLNESSIFIKTAWQLMCNFFSLFYCTLYKKLLHEQVCIKTIWKYFYSTPILSYPISDSPILSSSILSFSYTILSYPIFRSTSNPISYLIFYPILSSVPSYPILSFFLSIPSHPIPSFLSSCLFYPILSYPFFFHSSSFPYYPILSFLLSILSYPILSLLTSFLFYTILANLILLPIIFFSLIFQPIRAYTLPSNNPI